MQPAEVEGRFPRCFNLATNGVPRQNSLVLRMRSDGRFLKRDEIRDVNIIYDTLTQMLLMTLLGIGFVKLVL